VSERRSHIGAISLALAATGAVLTRVGLTIAPVAHAAWLEIVAAGFEAGVVGGLADWFAVTALFRRPLGLPIPHTAIISTRREKIIDGIVEMVESDWLSPDVIGARLSRIAPSGLVLDWVGDPEHARRLGGPVRDLLRALARMLGERELAAFVERVLQDRLRALPTDDAIARWLHAAVESEATSRALESAATSLANFADRPATADELQWWIERSAQKLREGGKRLVPFFLRRSLVQRKLIEAACSYASSELRSAAADGAHPLRRGTKDALARFAERLAAGDPATQLQVDRLRVAFTESLEVEPLLSDLLGRVRDRLEAELDDAASDLSHFVERQLTEGIAELLADPTRREAFDTWVRASAIDLLRRHHHQIGLTVRENLDALDTGALVRQIEGRVGNDLQYIRLNGALVGGLIGLVIAALHYAIE
jgi:uncharacterized membrane-anchored protein YjiN (DUF445 family)